MEYYNSNIQLDKDVIVDIFSNFKNENTKMLVFGLGYDSKMWFNGNKNTYFIENKDEYIKLNVNDIPTNNIIKYDYKNINVKNSFNLDDKEIYTYKIPNELLKLAPFDIILIDGPEGWNYNTPGRLIPCFWSTLLSKPSTVIYVDDSSRPLENYCINKYFNNKTKDIFNNRGKCTKIIY